MKSRIYSWLLIILGVIALLPSVLWMITPGLEINNSLILIILGLFILIHGLKDLKSKS